jgi:site-specific DNA-methyltransferase (cytosine-N4-specific)
LHVYFKLFNSIKDEHEVELARLELDRLVGAIEPIRNFADELARTPLKRFVNEFQVTKRNDESDSVRFQDFLMHEVPYGRIQGFVSKDANMDRIDRLVQRLGYTREIYVVSDGESPTEFARRMLPKGREGMNYNAFSSRGHIALRAITNQYFLENCEYIIKVTPTLSRSQVDYFANRMFDNLMRFIYRIPASSKARIGKRFLDYLAGREEPSLYLAHGMHPYKGKFHPKMTRALVNITHPAKKGTLIDNFAGSGTLLVEACMMGFDSFGIEINPMSVLMANAKCALLNEDPEKISKAVSRFLALLKSDLEILRQESSGQATLATMSFAPNPQILNEIMSVAPTVYAEFSPDRVLEELLIARRIAEEKFAGTMQELLMLGIAMSISDLKNKKKKEFLKTVERAMEDIYRRARLLASLKGIIPLKIGMGRSFRGNTSDFKEISDIRGISGNVNSPPYSTALDYIKNDIAQLTILGLIRTPDDLKTLGKEMGGNPRGKHNQKEMHSKIEANIAGLPEYAIRVIRLLEHFGRTDHAFRLYAFYELMKSAMNEQMRVLKKGARITTVIGNNHFKLADHIEGLAGGTIEVGGQKYPFVMSEVVNNVKPIDAKPIGKSEISEEYNDTLPIRISYAKGSGNGANSGVYVEIENERVILLLGKMAGFEPEMVINRYLEKSRRGNIRYEAIVILSKTK